MKSPGSTLQELSKQYCLHSDDKMDFLLNFLYSHKELWTEFEEFCQDELAECYTEANDDVVNE